MDSALISSRFTLDPARIGSIGHKGSFQQLLKEATLVAPPLNNLATQTKYNTAFIHFWLHTPVYQAQI